MTEATVADGRNLRSERTRASLAAAYLDLISEGDIQPTAERVAERAGCSPRSVFKHFPDREALFAAAADIQQQRVLEQLGQLPDPEAPLDERIDAFVDQRTHLNEFMTPVRRAAQLFEPFSDAVAAKVGLSRTTGAAQIEYVFGPELDAVEGRAREDLLHALYTAAAWVNWESLRAHRELPVDRARAIVRSMLAAQLEHAR